MKKDEIEYIIADGSYSVLHFSSGEIKLVTGMIGIYENKYKYLHRISRKYLINKKYIKKLSFVISLKNGSKLDVPILARDYKKLTKIKKML